MSDEVDALVDELRWVEAAEVAARRGEGARAATLLGIAGETERLRDRLAALTTTERVKVAAQLARRGLDAAAALAWEAAGELQRAEHCLVRAKDLAAAARVAVARGDEDAAAAHLRARLAVAPDDDAATLALASLQLSRGRAAEAAATAATVARSSPARAAAEGLVDAALTATGAAPTGGGRYVDVVEIATSPSARVLRARDVVTGREVALKVLRSSSAAEARRRLEQEARAQQAQRHPHVVPVLELDGVAGVVVTPWMSGGSLRDALAAGPLPAARVAEIGAAIAGALGAAHASGVVHRDVTAANVLLDGAGAPYLADFGAAHLRDDAATVTAGLAGTLRAMAPEVRRGEPATAASDVYSLGKLLAEALSGSDDDPRAPSELGVGLGQAHDALLSAMTSEDPTRRPTANEARSRLLSLPWPARAARPLARAPETAPPRGDEPLATATVSVPRDDATVAAARIVAAGCALGLTALPTVRALGETTVLLERVVPAPTEQTPDGDARASAASRYLAEHGLASTIVLAGQRGPVVVPIALMPR